MPDTKPTIVLGFPFYPGNVETDALLSIFGAQSDKFSINFLKIGGSNTAKAFNMLWANALNQYGRGEAQYFAMLHSDCIPGGDWLETLWDELHALKLDVLSVVSPIKNQYGLTSCGCDLSHDDPWKVRRFTMTEIMRLPETFTVEDTISAGLNDQMTPLLVNTGCFLLDMSNPKWQEEDGCGDLFFKFTFYDRIRRVGDHREAHGISEDWDWSRNMASRGIRYAATRKVPLIHQGRWPYKNTTAWGSWKYDQAHPELASNSEDGTPVPFEEAVA